tara:strand:- start:119 stop:1009 length:891 start_codon:yes stop_codon:yes gene_type:complete
MAQADPQALQAQPYEFPFEVEVFDLPVSANGIAYRLYVRLPLLDEERRTAAPGVFYMLDGDWYFPTLAAGVFNTESFGHTPDAYMVGIGYQDTETVSVTAHRTRDYTPTTFTPPDASHPLRPSDYEGSGGAEAFLNVLETEIIPFIEARYPLDASQRGLIGKSYGGLFASYALLTRPQLFRQMSIISPSLWWDDFMLPRDQRAIMRLEAQTRDQLMPAPTRVVFTAGSEEERLGMVTDVNTFTEALAARHDANLDIAWRVLDDERHESIFPRAIMTSLRLLSGNLAWEVSEPAGPE